MIKLALKDAYYALPIHHSHRKYLRFFYQDRTYRVSVPSLEASAGSVAVHGYPGCDLPRRHVIITPTEQGAAENLCSSARLTGKAGLSGKEGEVLTHSLPSSNLPQSCPRFHNDDPSLPQPKRTSIVDTCRHLLAQGSGSVRTLSTLIGQMSHVSQTGILVAPLHHRGLQRLYLQAVSQHGQAGENDSPLNLPGTQRPRVLPPIDLTVWSDASKTDWGAAYQGISTGGHWNVDEAQWHINVLELRAATLALKALLQSQEAQHPPLKHIHLRIDNTTAEAYINRRGSTRSPALPTQALELWAIALTTGVSLTAQHIPGIQNVVADTASRQIETRTEWTLDRKIFQSICQRFYTPDVDPFASRLNH
ncbi:uncharacterized protein [Montipora foliosa]|uniref:uncharacterized protein n=1 Tax=Montipora foliosa TaxID=591990 RepID=UPI0035F1F7F1